MKITWAGHATFLIVTEKGTRILVDPFAPSSVVYDRKVDVVLVSHHHYDHYNVELLERARSDSTLILTTSIVASQIHGSRVLRMDKDEVVKGVVFRAVPAYNVGKQFHQKGVGIGFLLTLEGKTVYITGDTDIIPEMQSVRADVIIVPVGGTYTMNAKEASQVVKMVNASVALPSHWGSIVGTSDDAESFAELCGRGVVKVLKQGESVVV